ncbi:MAG: NADP-dependent oxidoreductase [Planctomycetota bacterium]|nr:MAG: NADP-dependent oxidoreductase [Planctomycetota bacterium]
MKAIRFHKFGGPEVLVLDDVPRPEPAAGELLVRVLAAGVNPVDWKVRGGMMRGKLPMIPGYDVAGVVDKAGAEVKDFAPGDRVMVYLALNRGGGYAEYATAPAKDCAKFGKDLAPTSAAAIPLAALTAWQALFETAKLAEGQTVLIHAGAGGVGHFAVQLAKSRGARVLATASEKNLDFLKELGADVAIDYRAQRFEDVAKDVDVVLDAVGGDTLGRSYGVLKKGGFVVSIVQPPDPARLEELGLRGSVMLVQPNGAQLAQIAELVQTGKLKPHVSATYPLAEARKAQEASATGHTRGKIVLKVAD